MTHVRTTLAQKIRTALGGGVVVATATGLLALAQPARAGQQNCQTPSGTSAIDEYCERIPSSTGQKGTAQHFAGHGAGGGGGPSAGLGAGTERALRSSGGDGAAVIALARTARAPGSRQRHSGTDRRSPAVTPNSPAVNPLSAVRAAAGSGSTLGGGFVWALFALTVAAVAAGWVQYRRGSSRESETL